MANSTNDSIRVRSCQELYTTSVRNTLITVECLITLFSFLGNLLVVTAVCRKKKLRAKINLFITSMAVSDLLIPICYLPYRINFLLNRDPLSWISNAPFREFCCRFVPYMVEVSIAVSILTMITIAAERLYHVLCPFKALNITDKVRLRKIAVIWIVAIAVQGYYLDVRGLDSNGKCVLKWDAQRRKIMMTTILVFQIVTPFLLLVVLSTLTIFTLLRNAMNSYLPCEVSERRVKRNKRITLMLALVTMVFIAAWMPFSVYYIRLLYGDKERDCKVNAASVAVFFSYTAINPIIYFVFVKGFRKEFKKILCYVCKDSKKANRNQPLLISATPIQDQYKESIL